MIAPAPCAVTPGALDSKRAWTSPTLRKLPKLSALTLASAIGGGGGTGGSGSTVFGVLLAAGLLLGTTACADDRSPSGGPSEAPPVAGQLVSCTVDRFALSMNCASPQSTDNPVTLGGQGTVVALRSSGLTLTFPGTDTILSANVTVQNLSAGPLGTTDGVNPSGNGIRVFFVAPPVATPEGTVSVNNETGTATFTAGGQEYFEYPGMLAPQATSAPMTWEFLFEDGAENFTFSVLISTEVPAAGAVVRWTAEPGFGEVDWQAIRGYGTEGLAVFGGGGIVMVNDSDRWVLRHDPLGHGPTSAGGAGAIGSNEVYAFVNDGANNQIRYWDGIGWRDLLGFGGAPNPPFLVASLLARGHNDLYTSGFRFYRFDGTSWTNLGLPNSPTNDRVSALRVLGSNILGIAKNGEVWSWNGSSWSKAIAATSGQDRNPTLTLASDLGHVWVFDAGFPYVEVKYWDGVSWAAQALPNTLGNGYTVRSGVVFSATDVYVIADDNAGFGYLWHWDGATWSQVRSVTGRKWNDIWARSPTEIYLAGSKGWIERGDGAGNWTPVVQPIGGGLARSVRVISNGDVYVGTETGSIAHYNGTDWIVVASLSGAIRTIWAWSSANVWATSNSAVVAHFDGSGWSNPTLPAIAYAIAGWAPGDLWAVGDAGAVSHFNGTSWSVSVAPNTTLGSQSYDAVWAGSANFAAAVGQDGVIGQWNGGSWSQVVSPTGAYLRAISGTDDTHAWAVGDFGTVVTWDGTNWTASNIGTAANLRGVWAASTTEVYATSAAGVVYLYNGSSWTPMSLPPLGGGQNFEQIHGKVNGRVYVTGTRLLRGSR